MNKNNWHINLYFLNFALLFTHEIDSAYWKEWELFGIPGGIQAFLLLNFLLLVAALFGFKQLLLGEKGGKVFSLVLAGGGIFAFGIHTYFILARHPEFRLPASLAVLGLTLIVSLVQGFVAIREIRQKRGQV